MGRGRAKAKQTKVARDLKYHSPATDYKQLERELSGLTGPSVGLPSRAERSADSVPEPADPYEDPYDDAYADAYVERFEDSDDEDADEAHSA